MLRIFFALKNPTTSAGFEPANLGTKGQHATSRPLKALNTYITWRGNEYELPEDDTIVSKHVESAIIYKLIVIVLLLVILQNNKNARCMY